MGQRITCICVGGYEHVFTRGKQYELIDYNEAKGHVRVRGDNNRTRWYNKEHFDLEGGPVVSLVEWRFTDPVINPHIQRDETNNYVEASMSFDDGSERWCNLMTPDYLKDLLAPRDRQPEWMIINNGPARWDHHTIYIWDLKFETVDWTLRYMDQNNELISHTRLIQPYTEEDDEEEDGE